ncbi:zinc finger protein 277 isoform X1 [Phyllopteryx taeniolatus]|uniref:zinc finger protein 277 isoform X1 n=1 Tax=Phyllopteryx taeniolatus TaxID=161469 RepID=UPI002AD4A108|nr:zinc finger protein 277 isoform X1 [Phyllopteryx taeniolatus]
MAASDRSGDGVDHILEPLCFPEQPNPPPPGDPGDPDSHRPSSCRGGAETLSCLFCPESLPATQEDVLLKHLLLQHNLVIADVKLVADLPKYLLYWKGRFLEQPITDFCSEIKTNSTGPVEKQERYFLLCDVLPEDRALREKLQQKRLEEALEQQQKERDDRGFRRVCMFCNDEFAGNRADLLNHMAREHAFSVGLPDNIVYCNELLDTLQSKVDNLQCLYCEKTFKDKMTLKDHMRKKAHRRINPSNRQYDRFYIINYLELGKTWEEVQREDDRELPDDKDDDWSEWRARPVAAVCLFCDLRRDTADDIYAHMKKVHDFDLQHLRAELSEAGQLHPAPDPSEPLPRLPGPVPLPSRRPYTSAGAPARHDAAARRRLEPTAVLLPHLRERRPAVRAARQRRRGERRRAIGRRPRPCRRRAEPAGKRHTTLTRTFRRHDRRGSLMTSSRRNQ